jgi:hypothetical protein
MMGVRGTFHARMTLAGVEAWLGDEPRDTLWPEDYFVRLGPPAELIGATGTVVAQEGDTLRFAGGMRGSVLWLQAGPGQPSPAASEAGSG